ncbi:MAG: cytochrome c-type biogenesis protein CcmH [Acidimicrobiia bacterium]|nr:cytochrome c-type biogenesis protein CcmH [Acidimicrobiia bacterium]
MSEVLRRWLAGVCTVALAAVVVVAMIIGEDTAQDRVLALGTRIKCPVCQGESIAESPSETSTAMLSVVAEKVAAGESDGQIIEYFTDRYGSGILLDPPFRGRTLALWLTPLVALAGGVALILGLRRRRVTAPAAPDGESR